MSITRREITRQEATAILSQKEGSFLEFKSRDISPADLTKTMSAFANAGGGEIYIGIDERRLDGEKLLEWRGFADEEAANGHLQAFESTYPLGQEYRYEFLTCPGFSGLVLQTTVRKSREIRTATNGKVYVRRGAQNLPVETDDALRRLRYDKGIQSFEFETVDAEVSTISQSDTLHELLAHLKASTDAEAWLRSQRFIHSDKPTVAGILLFADTPQAFLPKRSGVKIYRYSTTAMEGSRETLLGDIATVEGCLYNQIKEAVNKTVEYVESIGKITRHGTERVNYPKVALHEIITNALLHRDYSIPADTHVRIFDNRIEVESPGKLPGHITKGNILGEQFYRNGAIVRMIHKFPDPPNKEIGEGLRTAYAAMRKMKLQPPEFEEREHSFVVHIKHEPLPVVDELIMDYLDTHEEITNQVVRDLSGIPTEREVRQAFYRLRNAGLIELVPGRVPKKRAWRKTSGQAVN